MEKARGKREVRVRERRKKKGEEVQKRVADMANPETGRLKKRGAKLSGLIEDFERGNWRNLLRKFESEK